MTAARCSRAWQAEAVEDERLSRADEASFERHLETCRECATERAELLRLRQVVGRFPVLTSTPLRRRFLHHELLRRANERAIGAARPGFDRKRLVIVLFAAVCVAAALLAVIDRSVLEEAAPVARSAEEPLYRVLAAEGGHFHPIERGPSLRLALSAGSFEISVRKLHASQRFLVNLPDGELEVRGTRFRVDVDSKTRRVSVSEGLVALRLSGHPEIALSAGDSWPKIPPAPEIPPVLPPAPTASSRNGPSVRNGQTKPPVASATGARSSAEVIREQSNAASEFATAMAAFSRGDFATAEQLFLAFEAHQPKNAHVEDTLFLRALCRLRRGDEDGAGALARDYLRRYPDGFRVKEAERLAR